MDLIPAMSELRPHLGDIVAAVEEQAPYGAVLLMAQDGLQINVDNREERVTEAPRTLGAVVSAFDGVTMHEQSLSSLDQAAVARAARDLAHAIDRPTAGRSIDPGQERRGDFDTPISTLSTQEKLERCRALHAQLRNLDARIVNARVVYADVNHVSVFRNRAADLAQHVPQMHLMAMVLVSGPDGVRYNYSVKSTSGNWDELSFSAEELQSIVDDAIALLTAERIVPGEYTIVASPGVAGTICHESFGHGVETDMFLKERAKAAHYVDQVVGSPLVNIVDDPSLPDQFGSYFFDDEGQLAAPTPIVENGIFKRGITDLYSALALNIPRSANGRRQDYSRKAYARMSNTFFAPGATPVADLFAQVDQGIYLEKWESGMEDPQGWGIQVTCHYGREIKHGQVTNCLFAPIGITGYVPDVLQTVTAVADDLELDPGFCGKGHKELILVSSGGPHMLLKARLG